MAGTTGLEPATSDVTGRRSNQLNYVPAFVDVLNVARTPRSITQCDQKHRPHRPEYTDARRPALIQIHAPVGRANLVLIFKEGLHEPSSQTPFDNIESSHEYIALLADAVDVAITEIETDLAQAAAAADRRTKPFNWFYSI